MADGADDLNDRRGSPRGAAARATTTVRAAVENTMSRKAQVVAGFLVGIIGIAILYPPARRLIEQGAFGGGEIAFFVLGALLLLAGCGIAIGDPFWRQAGRAADLGDGVLDRVRGKGEPSGAPSNE
jgi:predicted PurR-regulated permease PerM